MTVKIEKNKRVWTIIHSRPEARNAMDPDSADALYSAFIEFENSNDASVAVFWGEGGSFCAGWDLKYASSLKGLKPLKDLDIPNKRINSANGSDIPRGPMGPSRLELTKPVIGAISGPAVAGGMELALWCDFRVMEKSSYLGVYCRRWGIPLLDGGTVRLPKIVGQGRALEIILTGRKVMAKECKEIGLCEYVVEDGNSREKSEEIAHTIAKFPQECVKADKNSVLRQNNMTIKEGLYYEWQNSSDKVLTNEGIKGANRFSKGKGRHGDFENI
ncbi:MAG: Short-chain-enoyl-CoA hydratase [Alphaproteobacteria bacterium MarineAlpha9_Bin4]|nr:enoyl-CoA hydratase [Pelagibacterales bacterium]PPR24780.1 MAG: Short-chain-enoyl-CoA hydratase [Alphaproteobacteria bacterium MarineAlpha9_Bin4]